MKKMYFQPGVYAHLSELAYPYDFEVTRNPYWLQVVLKKDGKQKTKTMKILTDTGNCKTIAFMIKELRKEFENG